jgi:hypothetical protein
MLNRHLNIFASKIDEVGGLRGAGPLLVQFWTDVKTTGSTVACENVFPEVPVDYVVPEEELNLIPGLRDIQTQVNLGLQMLRDGWTLFAAGCQNGTLTDQADLGLTQAQTAQAALDSALQAIVDMRNR